MDKTITFMEKTINLTESEYIVYELLLKDPYVFRASTATEISSRYNISQSSISRFCQKLGFNGFSDFRLSSATEILTEDINDDSRIFSQNLFEISKIIEQSVSNDELNIILNKIYSSKKIYTSGYASSSLAAKVLYFNLMILGFNAINIEPATETETLRIMNRDDIIFIFSMSNPSHRDFFNILEGLSSNKRPYTILVAGTNNHPFKNYVDCFISIPYAIVAKYGFKSIANLPFTIFSYWLTSNTHRKNKNSDADIDI